MCVCSDHCGSGGDAEEGEGAGGRQEETGSDQTAAVQVPAQRAARRQQLRFNLRFTAAFTPSSVKSTRAECACMFEYLSPSSRHILSSLTVTSDTVTFTSYLDSCLQPTSLEH